MPLDGINRKRKGTRFERDMVKELQDLGLNARRQYGSGAFGTRIGETRFQGDIAFTVGGENFRAELKARANGGGFAQLDNWKGNNDFLFLKQDRCAPRIYCDFEAFKRLLDMIP